MSLASPTSKAGFSYAGGDLFAEATGHNRHRRATPAELKEHFKGGDGNNRPAHWFEAQLIHYGLPPSKTKGTARMRLYDAVQAGKMAVPAHVKKIEAELKKEWDKKERDAKKALKSTAMTKAQGTKRKADTLESADVTVTVGGTKITISNGSNVPAKKAKSVKGASSSASKASGSLKTSALKTTSLKPAASKAKKPTPSAVRAKPAASKATKSTPSATRAKPAASKATKSTPSAARAKPATASKPKSTPSATKKTTPPSSSKKQTTHRNEQLQGPVSRPVGNYGGGYGYDGYDNDSCNDGYNEDGYFDDDDDDDDDGYGYAGYDDGGGYDSGSYDGDNFDDDPPPPYSAYEGW
ncbi:hypothetical protein F5Y15DRAFT_411911 [Xylariaceae sp. FL0016]|nr:hypothetical protein F5Y15DRAFT_411911 [Xylariaceae sp. FL0016]